MQKKPKAKMLLDQPYKETSQQGKQKQQPVADIEISQETFEEHPILMYQHQ